MNINGTRHIEFNNTFRSTALAATCIGEYVYSRFEDDQLHQLLLYGVTRTEKPYLLLDDKGKLWEGRTIFVPLAVARDHVEDHAKEVPSMIAHIRKEAQNQS